MWSLNAHKQYKSSLNFMKHSYQNKHFEIIGSPPTPIQTKSTQHLTLTPSD